MGGVYKEREDGGGERVVGDILSYIIYIIIKVIQHVIQ